MKKIIHNYFPLILVISIGILLRTVFLNVSPPSLNEDEAALGYNAYSILKTGADEHGKFLPLSLESFGDWKLPVYPYVDVVPVALFGLNEFAVRFPSILAGITGIVFIYFISQKLFKKKIISLFSAFFYAVSPWNIYFSRAAYEVNLATTLFLGGFLLFLISLERKKNRNALLTFSGILFGLTLFTYHSFIIFIPLFSIFLAGYTLKEFKKSILFFLVALFIFILASFFTNYATGGSKFTTTTIFNNHDVIYNRVENFKKDTLGNPPVIDKIHSKYLGVPYQILQNYLNSFSPTFLFDRGGEKLVHNLDGFGNLYAFDVLLLFAGLAGIFYFREKKIPYLFFWLILAPIPSSITLDAPNTTRLFILMPLFTLISGFGVYTLFTMLHKNPWGKILIGILCALFILNVVYFLDLYFVHFGAHRARFWHYGYKEAVELSNRYKNLDVVMRGEENFPYIYFLFYNAYCPSKFQKQAEYYPTTWDGFRYVKKFGRYTFVDEIDYGKLKPNTLYINDRGFPDKTKVINLPGGDPVLGWIIK